MKDGDPKDAKALQFILEKVIERGTWRYLGQRCLIKDPHGVPIAGDSLESIKAALKGRCYRVGRISTTNAFLVVVGNAQLLYVRPQYKSYRKLALRVFPSVSWPVDFDHALSRNIAIKASPVPRYVLLLRIPPGVNRQHGFFEKFEQLPEVMPSVCFADLRIWDKWLGRPPKARNRPAEIMLGYSPAQAGRNPLGLTLKQKGRWAYAIGMDDDDYVVENLIEIIAESDEV